MTEHKMHTKDVLAAALHDGALASGGALTAAGSRLHEMGRRAAQGYYHDFLSPLDMPEMQLVADLASVGTPIAMELRQRAINGDFDANLAESEEWAASPEGQAAMS